MCSFRLESDHRKGIEGICSETRKLHSVGAHPKVNERTSGVYWRADPQDMSILEGRDDRRRAELIAERLKDWKSITKA